MSSLRFPTYRGRLHQTTILSVSPAVSLRTSRPTKWFPHRLNSGTSFRSITTIRPRPTALLCQPVLFGSYIWRRYPMYLHNEDGSLYALDENGTSSSTPRRPIWATGTSLTSCKTITPNLGPFHSIRRLYATFTFLKDFEFTVKGRWIAAIWPRRSTTTPNIGDGASNGGRLSKNVLSVQDLYLPAAVCL